MPSPPRPPRRSRRPAPPGRREEIEMAQDLGDPPAAPRPRTRKERDAAARARLVGSLSELADVGVRAVRLQYADLHGICRGKLIPISAFPHVAEEGMGFVEAIMTVDLRHNVVAGFERGFPDLLARPDLDTLVPLPWEEDVVACLVDLEDPVTARAPSARLPGGLETGAGPVLRVRRLARGRAGARVLPDGAGRLGSARLASVCRAGQRGVHGRRHGRPEGDARAHARRRGRARARRDRRRPRIRPQPVRDQPPALRRARLVRPRVPLPRDGQGDGGARRAARDVHGQAVQRRRGVGLPPPRVAGRFGRV